MDIDGLWEQQSAVIDSISAALAYVGDLLEDLASLTDANRPEELTE